MKTGLPTNISVDQFMPSFVPGGMGGTETYARQIFASLLAAPEVSVLAYVPESAEGFTRPPDERVLSGVTLADTTWGRLLGVLRVRLRSREIQATLRKDAVTFVPFTTPLLPVKHLGKTVITLHDIQHRELPELFSAPEKLYRKFTYERVARKVDHIITDSQYAKDSIVRELQIPADNISVIHLGVNTEGFAPNLGQREDFVYYPARGWAHKNHQRLFQAMEIVRQTHPRLRLVLTGGALDQIGEVPDWVDRKGLVSFDEVQEFYRKARVLAFPSLYEGFGFPPLEAMASGCPVAASNAASIPEICGDAATYFDPHSVEDIARGILAAIDARDQLVPLGLEHVKKFSWESCTEKHLEVFRAIGV